MFNFTTQTVYNNIVKWDLDSDGRENISNDANLIVGDTSDVPSIRIGNTRFDSDNVEKIEIKLPSSEKHTKVTFDMADAIPSTGSTSARIVLYVGLSMNSQDSFYANNYVYKGKPLFIEFPVSADDTPDVIATRAKKIADKYLLFTMGDEKILKVTETSNNSTPGSETGTVSFEGVNGYQQIKKAVLLLWNPSATTVDCCTTSGAYEDKITGVPVIYKVTNDAIKTKDGSSKEYYLDSDGTEKEIKGDLVPIYPGLEAFGNYDWLIHNLRLPTLANTSFWSPTKHMGELPVVGQNYTQFIITLKADREGIAGEVVGQRATSVTTHVFYVLGNAGSTSPAKTVKDELTTLFSSVISTTADTKLANPFNTSKSLTT